MAARILIVDDSAIALEMLAAALREAGLEPVGACDLAAVAKALQEGPFQALVLDLNMPEAFGDDLAEYLRNARGLKVPVILYSDVDESLLAERAKAVGADGYVSKSGGIPKLVKLLQDLAQKPPAKQRRVMIVDDSTMTAKLIEAELAGKGFEVVLADSVDKATRLILKKASRPELILLDVNMPNVNGAHFCRFIKGNSLFKGIKVVLCSGMEVDKLKAIAQECGADGFVQKDAFLSKWVLDEITVAEQKKADPIP